uniref:Uncharacterized protein n=1 Tax=Candidatus Kentrum sp. TC TaxID=2126339 RepID=A0A450YYJ0_9GAMM|nr:MAG: hypothetical protein BECKTC1821E_GA0114239_106713 [Candidatus Kentron sp. TC]
MTDNWLRNEIQDGLTDLVLLGLPDHPPEDAMRDVSNAWMTAFSQRGISLDRERDRPRVRDAFKKLLLSPRWPTPHDFFRALAPRPISPAPSAPKTGISETGRREMEKMVRMLSESKRQREAQGNRAREARRGRKTT